jgi:hypothetical protein
MIIEIDKDYRIITDENQYIVQRAKITKASKQTKPENIGKPKWINIAYVSSITFALRFICKNITLLDNDTQSILAKLDNVYSRIDELDITLKNKLID